ncbi:MAG: flagellin [Candidatus Caenarcaniphilales bacterium]|nr:flagellin [Candidatus Caenarcaniphilales bacterium]
MSILSLNTNIASKVTTRTINHSSEKITNSTRKLATGSRVNKAGDDVAALSIGAKLDTQLRGISKAKQNILDVFNEFDQADAKFKTAGDLMFKMKELFVQGLNGTNSQDEIDALQREINEQLRVFEGLAPGDVFTPEENDMTSGDYIEDFQVGANDNNDVRLAFWHVPSTTREAVSLNLSANLSDFGTSEYSGRGSLNMNGSSDNGKNLANLRIPGTTLEAFTSGITGINFSSLSDLDIAIENLGKMQATAAAKRSYFEAQYAKLEDEEIALSASKSHFMDTDMAEESANLTREQIRLQSASAMSTQANAQGQFVLSLLP